VPISCAMRPNPLRSKWAAGQPALGSWVSIPSQLVAEAVAANDLDYVVIDCQHGFIGFDDTVRMLAALNTGGVTPIVRVPELSTANISRVLDAGAMGVIIPMVNSAEEAAAAVAFTRFPPVGVRSIGAGRALIVEGGDYYQRANEEVACIPMIETMEAIDDLDNILSVPGVDVAYVGPSDLAVAMGYQPGTAAQPFLDMLDHVVEACNRHGVLPGIQATPGTAADRVARGYQMVTMMVDLPAFRAALARGIADAALTDEERSHPALY